MAEAHSAVAFSFSVTPEGFNLDYNHEVLRAVWISGIRSWKRGIARFMNHVHNGVYPASPASWIITTGAFVGMHYAGINQLNKIVGSICLLPGFKSINSDESTRKLIVCVTVSTGAWLTGITFIRFLFKFMLSYHGWMYESRGKMSMITKLWLVGIKILVRRKPLLNSYQASLPSLPVPPLNNTMKRYLSSVRPLVDDTQYVRLQKLVSEFKSTIGSKLQRYLILKSWWSSNYVSDWWEEYVYLRGRSPIMVNSNFYGLDAIMTRPTTIQVSRAANIVYSMLIFRRDLNRETIAPILLNNTVPLCSAQYERQFNTTRIPGEETDTLKHYADSKHIVVYHKGRYFKVYIFNNNYLLTPCQLEATFQKVIDDESPPVYGELELAALTAGDRIPWARARIEYFSKGVNKISLETIEKAAFLVALDEDEQDYDENDPTKLNNFGKSMLHGKGYDRWFDKSFTLVVTKNGRIGFNAEHSWADAPIMAYLWETILCEDLNGADAPIMGHLWEHVLALEYSLGYTSEGKVRGDLSSDVLKPIRLQFDINEKCMEVINQQLSIAKALIQDVDLYVMKHDVFGKGVMKKCKLSPDAFIQMALQLAYYREAGKFCLTYEASMTRLFREGRTETVRSCSIESKNFVEAMEKNISAKDKIKLLQIAVDKHQLTCKEAMTGRGIDRHLFCLYVVSKYLGIESPFLKEVLSEPWRLSTSQTPHQQTDKLDVVKYPEFICSGGGFGPVADDGYGVSYIIAGENCIFFHISSKISCSETNSTRFAKNISNALADIKNLF